MSDNKIVEGMGVSPQWLIQTNAVNIDQAIAVTNALISKGRKVIEVHVDSINQAIHFPNNDAPEGTDVIPYGSTLLVKLARKQPWKGVFYNDNFQTAVWSANRSDMLNAEQTILPASQVGEYLKEFNDDVSLFIRPAVEHKAFSGGCWPVFDLKTSIPTGRFGRYEFDKETLVAISPVVDILSETRWFVVDGVVVSGGTYRLRNESVMIRETNSAAIAEAQNLADVWLPMPTCVMDLATTPEGVKVVEFNCFNSSGFYNHDMEAVVEAASSLGCL